MRKSQKNRKSNDLTPAKEFDKLVQLVEHLRSGNGCPWDRVQTLDSVAQYSIDEAREVVDAIRSKDPDALRGEVGDLLLQAVFIAKIAEDDGLFDISDVIRELRSKLVRRHPHVFGDVVAKTPEEVLRNWKRLKAKEKRDRSLRK